MPQKLILAGTIREAHAYARAADFNRGSYRVVHKANQIRSVRNAEVHLLSSFTTVVSRHSVLSALRMARTLEVLYVDFADGEIVDGDGPPEPDPRGEITDEMLTLAFRANSIFAASQPEDDEAAEQAQADAIDEADIAEIEETFADATQQDVAAPVNKRRVRCKDCGELFHPTNPTEAAEHVIAGHGSKVAPAPADEPSWTF